MFASTEDSSALRSLNKQLKMFDKSILLTCEKQIFQRVIKEEEIIKIGVILQQALSLNGISKRQFLARLNRTSVYKRQLKDEKVLENLLEKKIEGLSGSTFTDSLENIRQIILHCDENQMENLEKSKWLKKNSEELINCITNLKFSTNSEVEMEESCYSIAILVYRFPYIFVNYYKNIINYLLMVFTEGSSYVQAYVDSRNDKLRETTSSYDQDTEVPFHFPLFSFDYNKCLNKLLSIAYFTLAFCFDYAISPKPILFLLSYIINTKEVCRYNLAWLVRTIILTIDKDKCKTDNEWTNLPWRIHNELIKLYIDRNSKIRNMASEISSHIKQCSDIKLPFITKPILDTVDLMTLVIDQKRYEPFTESHIQDNEMNNWKKWLELDKTKKLSEESESVESTSSRSKTLTISIEDDQNVPKEIHLTGSDLFPSNISGNELLPQHARKTIILPNLKSIISLTQLRSRKPKKALKKIKIIT